MARENGDLLHGTLGLLILEALAEGEMHGHGIGRWISDVSSRVLDVPVGSLYPALRRLQHRGFITARWGASQNNRRACFYTLTLDGRQHLKDGAATWLRLASVVTLILEPTKR